jgi:hypothetical protein
LFLGAHCFSSRAHFGFFFFSCHPNYHFFLGELLPTPPTYLPPFLLPAHLPTYLYWTSPSTFLILLTPHLCLCSLPLPTLEIQWDQGLGLQSFRRVRRNKWTSLECPKWEELGASMKNNRTTR